MPTIALNGCTPQPIANYLKALGVLRVVVTQMDAKAKGFWQNDIFHLVTDCNPREIEEFFLEDYRPTPIISPWNGSTGFYGKDKQKPLLDAIINSQTHRLKLYGETIQIAQQQVNALKLEKQPTDRAKKQLITNLRNTLPDAAIKWLDTCVLISSPPLLFPPLTGTGGNDGNFEFGRTFMQQLQLLFDFYNGTSLDGSKELFQAAVFAKMLPNLAFSGKIGQFNPIAAGGVNAAPGFEGDSRVNPWDFVLMLEGTLLFTAGATRRYECSNSGELAYPFTVKASNVGYGSASDEDETRGEIWLPLWENPACLKELEILFREGRAKFGKRAAKTGLDFALAISSLGVYRGISDFLRYSLQVRNGLSYFAIYSGRFQPKKNPQIDRLAELDPWVLRFREIASDSKAPASIKQALRKLDNALFELANQQTSPNSKNESNPKLLDLIVVLGEVEKTLNRSLKFTTDKGLRPLPYLRSSRWLIDCYEDSPEFRLALSLSRISLREIALRERLVQVRGKNAYWQKEEDGITIWQEGSLVNNLIALIRRIDIEEKKKKTSESAKNEPQETNSDKQQFAPLQMLANFEDISKFIEGNINEKRLEALARGLALIQPFRQLIRVRKPTFPPPLSYALLALAHRRTLSENEVKQVFGKSVLPADGMTKKTKGEQPFELPIIPELLGKLAAGDCLRATDLAAKRLRASGLKPAICEGIYESPATSLRIAAALAFPISEIEAAELLKQIRLIELE